MYTPNLIAMVKRLTLTEQRRLVTALPMSRKSMLRAHCVSCQQRGEGIKSILKSARAKLGPIARELGPIVFKELVAPFILSKIKGKGLKLAGQGLHGSGLSLAGSGLSLAGGRKRHKLRKK